MKRIFASLLTGSLLFASSSLLAHEGHDEAPGQLRSQFGGIIKPGKQLNVELVTEGNKVSVYPVGHADETLNPADLKVTATAKAPKGKAAPLKLEKKGNAFEGMVDFKTASRVELEVQTAYKGKTDSFKFQVEKQ